MRYALLAVFVLGCYESPDYAGTRFKCDDDHGCPPGQTCSNGFCSGKQDSGVIRDDGRSPGGPGVLCGAATCGATDKCCHHFPFGGPQCIALTASCDGVATAKCDGVEDCAGAPCCDIGNNTFECSAACTTSQACREDADCPNSTKCCFGIGGLNEPWGRCLFGVC